MKEPFAVCDRVRMIGFDADGNCVEGLCGSISTINPTPPRNYVFVTTPGNATYAVMPSQCRRLKRKQRRTLRLLKTIVGFTVEQWGKLPPDDDINPGEDRFFVEVKRK